MTQMRKTPDGYNSVQPYLICTDSKQMIAFLAKAFGATERLLMKDDKGRVAHAEVQIGNAVVMMADEHPAIGAYSPKHYGGSPVSLMIYVHDCDTSYQSALAAGATSEREPADQPYGDRMAGVVDPFGYKWWIGHSLAAESTPQ
jgi:PhnB protein